MQPVTQGFGVEPTRETGGERLVLPGGLLRPDGRRCREVSIRELCGADEEQLADRSYATNAAKVTDFLTRIITEMPELECPVDRELVADMLVGDRDYILLRVRQLSLGDAVHQVMRCPAPSCAEKVDVEFLISEIEVRRPERLRASYPLTLSRLLDPGVPASDRVVVRLPTGRDQHAVAGAWDQNVAQAQTLLLARLVRLDNGAALDEAFVHNLPTALRRELLQFVTDASPGPSLNIEIQCPHCARDMSYEFDLHRFFFEECRTTSDLLLKEVHMLALSYHWSEREILTLPRARRRRYLSLLANGDGTRGLST